MRSAISRRGTRAARSSSPFESQDSDPMHAIQVEDLRKRFGRTAAPMRARCSCGPLVTPGLAGQQLEVLDLAHERVVLALELTVGLSGRLEHREGEGCAAVA